MTTLEELNQIVYELEQEILTRKDIENNMRKALEVAKLEFKSSLDPKLKEYSNDEKREVEACIQPAIKTLIEDLKAYSKATALKEIDLRFYLRGFNILLKLDQA